MDKDKTVIVYGTDTSDIWRIRKSIASLRRIGVAEDIVILTVGDGKIDDQYVLSQCRSVVAVDGILSDVGLSPDGWNRKWPYACQAHLAMPLVPGLLDYGKALMLDSDVLAITPRAKQWLTFSTRGFEVVGALGDSGTMELAARSDVDEVDTCLSYPGVADQVRARLWSRNPPYSKAHFSTGVCLWDLGLIRVDIDWYVTRLRLYWRLELDGRCALLTETLVNVFMDSAPLLSRAMGACCGDARSLLEKPAMIHFSGEAGDSQNSAFNVASRKFGIDEAIRGYTEGATTDAKAVSVTMRECAAGRLAVVHITDGDRGDCQRMAWSLRSLARKSGVKFDSFVVHPSGKSVPDMSAVVPELSKHGVTHSITDMDKTLESVGISEGGWNRGWPFVVLYRLGIPTHPAFDGYDRVLYLDTDTLVLSSGVDRFLSADISGYEVGGVVDTVQEEHDRIRGILELDLKPEFAERVVARYGDVLRLRPYVNAGVMLWNLPELRKDIPWYKERLGMFWEAECRGRFGFLDQDFINAMMSVNTGFSMVYNWFTRSGVEADGESCVIRHYCARNYSLMAAKAEEVGLLTDDDKRRLHVNV